MIHGAMHSSNIGDKLFAYLFPKVKKCRVFSDILVWHRRFLFQSCQRWVRDYMKTVYDYWQMTYDSEEVIDEY